MILDENQGVESTPEVPVEESTEGDDDTVILTKKDYESLNQTLGSLKRELKDLKKPKESPEKSTNEQKPESNTLLEKAFLRTAGIVDKEEVELALETAKKWGVSIDTLVDDEDFKIKLEKVRTAKSNALATAGIKGDKGSSSVQNSVEYWLAKGTPPNASEVSDRKTRSKIVRAFMEQAKNGKKFYND